MSFWPFRRKPTPPVDHRIMNEDWAVGDLAQCIDDRFCDPEPFDPKVGDVLRVAGIDDCTNHRNRRCIWLLFEGKTGIVGYECVAFRKLRPVNEPAEKDFIVWLRGFMRQPEGAQ